jgi:hypothetical protein
MKQKGLRQKVRPRCRRRRLRTRSLKRSSLMRKSFRTQSQHQGILVDNDSSGDSIVVGSGDDSSGSSFSYHESDELSSSDGSVLSLDTTYFNEMRDNDELQNFFQGPLCTKSKKACRTLQQRISTLCSWYTSNVNNTDGISHTVYSILFELIQFNYHELAMFFLYLNTVLMLKAATLCTYMDDIIFIAKWFVMLRQTRIIMYKSGPQDLQGLKMVLAATRKIYKKRLVEEQSSAPDSIEELIQVKRWPLGGLQELFDAVVNELPWLTKVLALNNLNRISYGLYMELLVAAAYVCSIQGRVKALDDLKVQDYDALMKGHKMSNAFKTSATFGLQPVTTSDLFRQLLQIYMEKVRLFVPQRSTLPTALLLISYDNTPIRVGRYVTRFFKRTLGLHITTTIIRCIVETSTEELHENGTVSNSERNSILNVNGHKMNTMKKFYLKKSRVKDVCHVADVFDKIVPNHEFNASPLNVSYDSPLQIKDIYNIRNSTFENVNNINEDFTPGRKHNHIGSPNFRIPWTQDEINFVGNWCKEHKDANNIVAKCLEYIRNDKEALEIFHPNHIFDSGRLRHGYDMWKRHNENVTQL